MTGLLEPSFFLSIHPLLSYYLRNRLNKAEQALQSRYDPFIKTQLEQSRPGARAWSIDLIAHFGVERVIPTKL